MNQLFPSHRLFLKSGGSDSPLFDLFDLGFEGQSQIPVISFPLFLFLELDV